MTRCNKFVASQIRCIDNKKKTVFQDVGVRKKKTKYKRNRAFKPKQRAQRAYLVLNCLCSLRFVQSMVGSIGTSFMHPVIKRKKKFTHDIWHEKWSLSLSFTRVQDKWRISDCFWISLVISRIYIDVVVFLVELNSSDLNWSVRFGNIQSPSHIFYFDWLLNYSQYSNFILTSHCSATVHFVACRQHTMLSLANSCKIQWTWLTQ